MTESQKIGANLFFGKAECASCHNGPALNGWTFEDPTSKFYAIGLNDIHNLPNAFITSTDFDVRDGRGGFTGRGVDFYKFKVPQLYNLRDTRFYGHGSSFSSVKAIIEYKNRGQIQNNNINMDNVSPRFKPLNLTEEEIEQLTDFIENALYAPDLIGDYQPAEVNSLNCIPNNDTPSRISLGCE
jgi:cytochrome c peroxidase